MVINGILSQNLQVNSKTETCKNKNSWLLQNNKWLKNQYKKWLLFMKNTI